MNVVNVTAKMTPKSDCQIRCANRKQGEGPPANKAAGKQPGGT